MSDDEAVSQRSDRPGSDGASSAADRVVAQAVGHVHATASADGRSAGLAGAVDGLETVIAEPVHTHAERYHEVHTLLQDALSDTDRTGS